MLLLVLALPSLFAQTAPDGATHADWPHYGGTQLSWRYSALDQINTANVKSLLPAWIPWHVFWVAFFGAVFIAAGLAIGLNYSERAGAAGLGLMFAIWVFTLHLPRVLGLYGIPGAPTSPDEWSSLFIAVALWGGPWALAGSPEADITRE